MDNQDAGWEIDPAALRDRVLKSLRTQEFTILIARASYHTYDHSTIVRTLEKDVMCLVPVITLTNLLGRPRNKTRCARKVLLPSRTRAGAAPIRFARVFALQSAISLAVGCTTISIETDGETVEVIRHAGVAYVKLPPDGDSVTEIRSLGFSSTSISSAFGFTHQQIAALNGDCRLVVWVEDITQLHAVMAIATDNPQICVISEEKGK